MWSMSVHQKTLRFPLSEVRGSALLYSTTEEEVFRSGHALQVRPSKGSTGVCRRRNEASRFYKTVGDAVCSHRIQSWKLRSRLPSVLSKFATFFNAVNFIKQD